ncbi:MAG: TonB-dependent receptor [Akkermansiaceae bacterium]|nr:TonB-dependent receptor [Akkermansiaceae bacterium]
MFIFEEINLAPFLLEFGARYDHQTYDAAVADRNFDAFSASSGIVYKPTDEYAVSFSVAYSQRPPTYVELFADGLHIATNTFEQGDLNLGKESSTSIDLSVRKKSGRVTGSAGIFYYRFQDFISLQDTGAPSGEVDDGGNPFNVFRFQADAADFVGGEAEVNFHLLEPVSASEGEAGSSDRLDLILRADYVRAENLDENESLPRTPPFRSSLAVDYQRENFGARLEGKWVADQNRTAQGESSTDGYFLVDAGVSYDLKLGNVTTTLSLKGVNLFDEEARQHTSFLKDVSTLSGRGVILGLRSVF